MAENFSNEYQTTLNGAIDASQTSIVVISDTNAPATDFRLRIDDEYMLVTAKSGTTFTVTRGIEGSTAVSHSDAATVTHVLTAGALDTVLNGPGRFMLNPWFFDDCYWKGSTEFYEGGIGLKSTNGGLLVGSSEGHLNHPGHLQVRTGTDAAGEAVLCQFDGTTERFQIRPEGTRLQIGSIIRLANLSDVTNRYIMRSAALASSATTTPSNALFFRYSDDVNGGNLQAVARSGGSETTADTGIAVASVTWYRLEIDFAADQSQALFYIDGDLVATLSSNLPASTTLLACIPLAMTKTAGTTNRTCYLDAYWLIQDFNNSR